MNHGLNIAHPVIGIILTEIAKCLLKFGLDIGVQLHPRRKAPEDVGCDREITSTCQVVAFLPNARIHAEYFRDNDNRGTRTGRWRGDIDGKQRILTQRVNLHIFTHFMLLSGHSPQLRDSIEPL